MKHFFRARGMVGVSITTEFYMKNYNNMKYFDTSFSLIYFILTKENNIK
jgi:hypothetical protein